MKALNQEINNLSGQHSLTVSRPGSSAAAYNQLIHKQNGNNTAIHGNF